MICVLSGGTGGAKFVDGLRQVMPAEEITLVVNTGDDLMWWGLYVSPDIDSITYVLSGMLSRERGWGVKGDTFLCLQAMGQLGEPTWFHTGDRDLAMHLLRSRLLAEGKTLLEATAIISQNGNAYEEGLSDGWDPIRTYWREPTQENRDALRGFLTPETTLFQYIHGVADPSLISPDGRSLDDYYLTRPGAHEAQLDLLLDYASNVALYPDFHTYFRNHQPPFLAVWGKNDPFFLPAGAEAFRRDIPGANVGFLETGHFALETHCAEIARAIRDFLDRTLRPSSRDTQL